MPEISSVDAAVEKLVAGHAQPDASGPETPAPKAPAEAAPAKSASPAPASPAEEGREVTAFEQELMEEFKEEYESLPESDRTPFLNALKRSYRKQAKQMTELGTLRKAVGALRDAGVTNEDLVDLVSRKRTGSNGRTDAPKASEASEKATRGFQRWLTEATDPAEKEHLRTAEQVIRETVEDLVQARLDEIRDTEVKPLKERLDWQDRQSLTKRMQTLEADINALEDEHGYPGSLVETHRETMKAIGVREPTLSAEDLLVRAAGVAAVKAAILKRASSSKADVPGVEGTSPPASVVKKAGPAEMPRNSRGVVSITKAIDLLMKPKR